MQGKLCLKVSSESWLKIHAFLVGLEDCMIEEMSCCSVGEENSSTAQTQTEDSSSGDGAGKEITSKPREKRRRSLRPWWYRRRAARRESDSSPHSVKAESYLCQKPSQTTIGRDVIVYLAHWRLTNVGIEVGWPLSNESLFDMNNAIKEARDLKIDVIVEAIVDYMLPYGITRPEQVYQIYCRLAEIPFCALLDSNVFELILQKEAEIWGSGTACKQPGAQLDKETQTVVPEDLLKEALEYGTASVKTAFEEVPGPDDPEFDIYQEMLIDTYDRISKMDLVQLEEYIAFAKKAPQPRLM